MIEKLKQKITSLIDEKELNWFMIILSLIFNKSEDTRIKRSGKSLFNLLNNERYDKIDREEEIR